MLTLRLLCHAQVGVAEALRIKAGPHVEDSVESAAWSDFLNEQDLKDFEEFFGETRFGHVSVNGD